MADSGNAASTSKIRVKIGAVEVEYEGPHDFLKEDLPTLLSTVMELRTQAGHAEIDESGGSITETCKKGAGSVAGTVGAIAAKLSVDSGSELIIAAAAKLMLVDQLEKFSRKALLDAMQTAASYYKQSYSKNLSKYLKGLQEAQRLILLCQIRSGKCRRS